MKPLRNAVLYSSALHVVVIAAGYYGMPAMRRPPIMVETPIMVEIVEVADETNAPVESIVASTYTTGRPASAQTAAISCWGKHSLFPVCRAGWLGSVHSATTAASTASVVQIPAGSSKIT